MSNAENREMMNLIKKPNLSKQDIARLVELQRKRRGLVAK